MLDSFSFFRVVSTGIKNFFRNAWLSASASIVMTVTLVIFSVLFLLFSITRFSIASIRDKVDVSVYFKTALSEDKILSIKKELETDGKIKEITYTSAERALEIFKEKHKNDPQILQSLNELTENPLPATLNIKAYNLDDYPQIAESLAKPEYEDYVSKISYEDNRAVIDRLTKILKAIVSVGLGLIAVFSLIAVLVINNTITLTIYNRKEEVEIMRLVGATNWYIRGPFLVECIMYSLSATVLTILLFLPVFWKVTPKITAFIDPEALLLNQSILNFGYLALMLLVISITLSMISTLWAIRKYLKI